MHDEHLLLGSLTSRLTMCCCFKQGQAINAQV